MSILNDVKYFVHLTKLSWIAKQKFTEDDWLSNFRANKTKFNYLSRNLQKELQAQPIQLSGYRNISVDKKVAVSLY